MRRLPTNFHVPEERPIVMRFEASSDGQSWVEIPDPCADGALENEELK